MEDLDALLADLQATAPSREAFPPPPPPPDNRPDTPDSPPPPLPPPPAFINIDDERKSSLHSDSTVSSRNTLGTNLSELDSLLEDLNNTTRSAHQDTQGVDLSELDYLLEDLNLSAKRSSVNKTTSAYNKPPPPRDVIVPTPVHARPAVNGPPPMTGKVLQDNRPTVEALLDELDSAVPQSKPQHGVINGSAVTPRTASTATKELDDLMASLSDFKVNVTKEHIPTPQKAEVRHSGDYAKPNKTAKTRRNQQEMSTGKAHQLDSMLGTLQSDMSRQGVSTVNKGYCAACSKPIIGQVCTALGKTWHPEHFACVSCELPLGTRNFFERDGKPYCEKDYHELFAPRCAYCNGPILDSCMTALDQTWHPDHFFCNACGKPFGEGGFHERDGKAYCREDYFSMFAPRCGGCNQAIMDNYISALNSHWHPNCFVCFECHQAFPGGSFFEHESKPYCEMHYHAKRGTLCYSCQKPITGRCITAMHRKFHPEHFICAFCLRQLNKGTFKEQNDKPYCHPCFIKLFG